jgi:hypothetical protein
LEAFTWGLFGKFLRSGMRADDAVNDLTPSDGCRVKIHYTNGVCIERWRRKDRETGLSVRNELTNEDLISQRGENRTG